MKKYKIYTELVYTKDDPLKLRRKIYRFAGNEEGIYGAIYALVIPEGRSKPVPMAGTVFYVGQYIKPDMRFSDGHLVMKEAYRSARQNQAFPSVPRSVRRLPVRYLL